MSNSCWISFGVSGIIVHVDFVIERVFVSFTFGSEGLISGVDSIEVDGDVVSCLGEQPRLSIDKNSMLVIQGRIVELDILSRKIAMSVVSIFVGWQHK